MSGRERTFEDLDKFVAKPTHVSIERHPDLQKWVVVIQPVGNRNYYQAEDPYLLPAVSKAFEKVPKP